MSVSRIKEDNTEAPIKIKKGCLIKVTKNKENIIALVTEKYTDSSYDCVIIHSDDLADIGDPVNYEEFEITLFKGTIELVQ